MNILLLINQASGRSRHKQAALLTAYRNALAENSIACKSIFFCSIEEARTQAMTASDVDAVVACGGDGTINAVADGVMKNVNKDMKFGVLYTGTSPDFCRFHHIPIRPRPAVELLRRGVSRPVEVLEIRHDGMTRHCFCSCNLGMGADMAETANRLRPFAGDRFGTFLALLWSIFRSRAYDYKVNDADVLNCNHLMITRMPYIAGGLKLKLPELKKDEYAVWRLHNLSLTGWLKLVPGFYLGRSAGIVEIYSSVSTISALRRVRIEYDGDPQGVLPMKIRVAERTLNLIAGE
ncbi:MAG: hypothetical protein JXR78_10220 [Victivallales bacterium]|nr:hypothetical protein [Victivallales bacterium]